MSPHFKKYIHLCGYILFGLLRPWLGFAQNNVSDSLNFSASKNWPYIVNFKSEDFEQRELISEENQSLHEIITLRNGVLSGPAHRYYLEDTFSFVNVIFKGSELNGPFDTRHSNGQVHQRGCFLTGALEGMLETFYPDGKLKESTLYVDGLPNGLSEAYHPNGALFWKGQYFYGKRTGQWDYFHSNNSLFKTEKYAEGKLLEILKYQDASGKAFPNGTFKNGNGELMVFNMANKLVAKQNFEDGLLGGKSIDYFESGAIRLETSYRKGKKIGPEVLYFSNGKKAALFNHDTLQRKSGSFQEWYENGKLKTQGFYKAGELDSTLLRYFDSGTLAFSGKYNEGIENGRFSFYFPNGKPARIQSYTLGLKDSLWQEFHPNGGLKQIAQFDLGEQTDSIYAFHENGKVRLLGYFEEGLASGKWKYFHENGQIAEVKNYLKGQLEGDYILCDQNGKRWVQGSYKEGKKQGEFSYLNKEGKTTEKEVYQNGLLESVQIFNPKTGQALKKEAGKKIVRKVYHTNGKLSSVGLYENGLEKGLWTFYNEEEQVVREASYAEGKLHGYAKNYLNKTEAELLLYKEGVLFAKPTVVSSSFALPALPF